MHCDQEIIAYYVERISIDDIISDDIIFRVAMLTCTRFRTKREVVMHARLFPRVDSRALQNCKRCSHIYC